MDEILVNTHDWTFLGKTKQVWTDSVRHIRKSILYLQKKMSLCKHKPSIYEGDLHEHVYIYTCTFILRGQLYSLLLTRTKLILQDFFNIGVKPSLLENKLHNLIHTWVLFIIVTLNEIKSSLYQDAWIISQSLTMLFFIKRLLRIFP